MRNVLLLTAVAGFDPGGRGCVGKAEPGSKPGLLRQMAEAAFGAPGAQGQLAAMGRVALADTAGKPYPRPAGADP